MEESKKIGRRSAVAIVVSSMIGTGVYTSLGYQVGIADGYGIKSVVPLLMLWLTGGLIALTGSLCYGELAERMPRSGGEYTFLSKLYHPAFGFASGFISATVAFAAPAAMAALGFVEYFNAAFPGLPKSVATVVGSLLIIGSGLLNLKSVKTSASFNKIIVAINISLIIAIIIVGLSFADTSHFEIVFTKVQWNEIFSSGFAISLVYVSFAYSGWNSIVYIQDDVKKPRKTVPFSLFTSTLIVVTLYLLLNFTFLFTTPISVLEGQGEPIQAIGSTVANHVFGSTGERVLSGIICIALIAAINSFMLTGPRVSQIIGQDFDLLKIFSRTNKNGVPYVAVITQLTVSVAMFYFANLSQLYDYIGFTLSIFTIFTVAGLFILRHKKDQSAFAPLQKDSYRTLGYPITPIIFISLEVFMAYNLLTNERMGEPAAIGLTSIGIGVVLYFVLNHFQKRKNT